MFTTVRHLLELIRFSHTLFALPFALLAAVMAWHTEHGFAVRWQEVAGILLCMITARSFAMAFNRLADRRIDAANPRTAGRHLPARILSVPQVTVFAALCAAGFIASTLVFLPNRLPLLLSIPVLVFLAGYSYAKRFTSLAHFWLGASLALSPVAAWIAIRGEHVIANPVDLLPAIVLGGAVLAWVAGFDMIYACQDYEADIASGHHSIPARVGIRGALRLAAVCHSAMIAFLISLPLAYPPFSWLYWIAVVAVAALLVYEHLLVRPDDLTRVNASFFTVNIIISLGLLAAGSLDLLIHRV
jgi:4-hydroxybenzoate polyprenyltransferase